MNKIICIIILLFTVFVGCDYKEENMANPDAERWQGFEVIVVDSCEYLIQNRERAAGYQGYGYGYMAHKGNCRFCRERNK